ncbi:MAG: LacI family DNA-binding transcriptional regulator [Clostridiaceae bacterium]
MTNPNDARSQWLILTDKGMEAVVYYRNRIRSNVKGMTKNFSEQEMDGMIGLAGADEQLSGFQKSGRHRIKQKKKITGGELMAVTIRDVAREAGVSVATVSHALTGYTDISVKTRQKIQETARRLGYQPNVNGRNLASKKSNRIALIIPDLLKRERKDNITFRMIQGVYGYCSSHGLEVAVYAHDPEEMTYRQFCESHAVEGILISDLITEDQRLQELMEIPVPFVAMHSECLAPEQRIGMDNAAAAADMTRYLLKNGHRKILVAAGSEGSMEQADRMIGVLSAMGQENLSLCRKKISWTGDREKPGRNSRHTGR